MMKRFKMKKKFCHKHRLDIGSQFYMLFEIYPKVHLIWISPLNLQNPHQIADKQLLGSDNTDSNCIFSYIKIAVIIRTGN